ncbi:hypothetical protein BRCON_1015 [Candidatus Sumerlaea chitinivorans]|uniref:Uncharacterized protein n=1 Tax=Sumerlaea chitinivorans TaxID=2250252 RepID=A0A2Z4Y4Z0_SUMC1|nr:hypothetical protein BRCON_1015 [Candidatus Sumerlaea chitinivorans]
MFRVKIQNDLVDLRMPRIIEVFGLKELGRDINGCLIKQQST